MPHPEKREGKLTGYWYGEVDYRNKGGLRYRRRFETRKAADGYEAYVRATGEEPPGLADEASGRTFAGVAAEAKDAGGKRGLWKRGRDGSVLQRLDTLCAMDFGKLPIERIEYSDLAAIVANLERRPGKSEGTKLSVGTINRYLTAASAVLSYAVSKKYRRAMPEMPWRKEAKQGRFHWLTFDQEQALCAALVSAGHAIDAFCVRVLCATGLRWGEFSSLEAGQVEDAWIRLWETKTDTPRSVPIEHGLAQELRANLRAQRLPIYITFSKHFASAVKACGYDPALTIHCLRHTTCTRLITNGMPMPKVQRFMGHKSINTTMRYFHMLDDDLAEAVNFLSPQRGETGKVVRFDKTA